MIYLPQGYFVNKSFDLFNYREVLNIKHGYVPINLTSLTCWVSSHRSTFLLGFSWNICHFWIHATIPSALVPDYTQMRFTSQYPLLSTGLQVMWSFRSFIISHFKRSLYIWMPEINYTLHQIMSVILKKNPKALWHIFKTWCTKLTRVSMRMLISYGVTRIFKRRWQPGLHLAAFHNQMYKMLVFSLWRLKVDGLLTRKLKLLAPFLWCCPSYVHNHILLIP